MSALIYLQAAARAQSKQPGITCDTGTEASTAQPHGQASQDLAAGTWLMGLVWRPHFCRCLVLACCLWGQAWRRGQLVWLVCSDAHQSTPVHEAKRGLHALACSGTHQRAHLHGRGHCARAQLQPEDPAAKCCACARLLAAVHGVHDFMSHKITHASVTLHFLPSPYTQIVHGIKMQGLHNTGSKVAGSNLNVLPKAASRP
eukprot:641636-Pelagomonas_calceolata.AAC.2